MRAVRKNQNTDVEGGETKRNDLKEAIMCHGAESCRVGWWLSVGLWLQVMPFTLNIWSIIDILKKKLLISAALNLNSSLSVILSLSPWWSTWHGCGSSGPPLHCCGWCHQSWPHWLQGSDRPSWCHAVLQDHPGPTWRESVWRRADTYKYRRCRLQLHFIHFLDEFPELWPLKV